MIKNIFIPVFLFFSLVTFAQQATSSPYSIYGIGDIRFKGTAENRMMGGVSVFTDSIHINLNNPASYAGIKLSTFSVGGSFNASSLTSYQGTEKAQRTTVDYMAVAMPVFSKSSITFGLVPYSSVGYKIVKPQYSAIVTDGVITGIRKTIPRRYEGEGGLNKVFVGYGYQLNKAFSIGADISYNFGSIETNNLFYPGTEFGTQELNNSSLSGLNVKIGAMFQKKIKKFDYYGSVAYTPQSDLRSRNTRTFSIVQYAETNTPGVVGSLDPIEKTSHIKLPSQVSFGAGFGQAKKWLIGTEIIFKQTSSFENRVSDIALATYQNGFQYSLGGYFIPNYNSFSNYFKKITYRAGLRYEKTGMVIRDESIRDYSFNGGVSLPLGGAFSNLNLGVEYGRRGTAKANLVEENYTTVIMSLSLNDKWFVKRKFN